jgi:hypothetical protein
MNILLGNQPTATLLLDLANFELSRRTPKGYAYPMLRTAGLVY